ncbi:MAG: hypothetical protein ACRDWI_13710 [Jiangellaceae bacterium]
MDQSAFYSIVSAINFTLLGLWWVAIKERTDIRRRGVAGQRMAYLVSLGFVIPGTVSLLAQVAPDVPIVWRTTFTLAGLAGAVGLAMLAQSMLTVAGDTWLIRLLRYVGVPLYLLVALVAAVPGIPETLNLRLSSIEIVGFLLTLLVFLGVQAAWVVAMTAPDDDTEPVS